MLALRRDSMRRRAGFTMLEVVLAMAIGMVLLISLYVALDRMMGTMQVGRASVEQSQVARGVLNRIDNDISHNLGPISSYTQQALTNWQNGTGSSSSPSSSTSPSSTGSTGSTGTTGAASSTSSSSTTSSAQGGIGPVNFNLMVQGASDTLTLYVVASTRDVTNGQDANDASVFQPPDLRRIAYWRDDDGLKRQEIKVATATDQLSVLPPDVSDPSTCKIIAPEVKSVSFQYFDGSAWQDSWDGTVISSIDGVSPIGPPMAIAIVITVDSSSGSKTYRHVVAIPTANNANPTFLQNGANNSTTQGTTGNQ